MIKAFKGKFAPQVWNCERSKFPQELQRKAYQKLAAIYSAVELDDLRIPPGNRLEALKGNKEGRHSIRINNQWRICFIWDGKDAYDVEILDYH